MFQDIKNQIPQHEFNVRNLANVDDKIIHAAQKAAVLVWNKHIGQPTKFNFIFCNHLVNPSTNAVNDQRSAAYDPETDELKFAMDTIAKRVHFTLSADATMIILSAHETTHKVQITRGDNVTPSGSLSEQEYRDNEHEDEAWQESVDVFKKVYPNANGEVTPNGKIYRIPEQTSY